MSPAIRPLKGTAPNFKSAIWKFCESLGRDNSRDYERIEEAAAAVAGTGSFPLRTTVDFRAVKRPKKTTKDQMWAKFRLDNNKKHHPEQHSEQLTKYMEIMSQKRR